MTTAPENLVAAYISQYADPSVVAAYRHRPPYPAEVFDILAALITDNPRTVLDVGCGQGEIARPLTAHVGRVDAVDRAETMIAAGKTLPGGDQPHLRWIVAPIEEAPLSPPYALITAGTSLHWMPWETLFPRFREVLTPNGMLAVIFPLENPQPWDDALRAVLRQHNANPEDRPLPLTFNFVRDGNTSFVKTLEERGLFKKQGSMYTAPVPFTRPIASYIESWHARNGFSRDRMGDAAARAFDEATHAVIAPHCPDGMITSQVTGEVIWGVPR